MNPTDPTTRPEWNAEDTLPGPLVVSEPPFGLGGVRGVSPWEITPGAPPVRGAAPSGRTLLRDATLRRQLLKKASATPVPGVRMHRRELEQAAKPLGHEREYFKPAHPLLTNVVIDRPPPVRKAADPTWDDLPPPRVATPSSPAPALTPDEAWFFAADGTLEPAEERESAPPRAVAGWVFAGAVVASALVFSVAVLNGPFVQASQTSIAPVLVGFDEEVLPEPVAPEPVAAEPMVGGGEPAASPPAARRAGAADLRAAMAANPLLQNETPAARPTDEAPVEDTLWESLDAGEEKVPLWGDLP